MREPAVFAGRSGSLHDLFAELTGEFAVGVVVVTHNRSLAARASRVLHLEDGRLVPASASEGGV